MSLIQDFWTYCQSYEIPRNHSIWTALGLMGAAVNRRVFVRCGDIIHHGTLYVCLVAEQGGKKSTCNDWARDFFTIAYDDIPLGCSVQSREDIVKFMASDDDVRSFADSSGALIEFHPFMMFINEFEQFLSFNTPGMLSFLVDIYDRKWYDASTIKRGLEKFPNPAVNLIACCTPKWLISQLRGNIFTGGICRRMVFVYEDDARSEDGSLVCIPIPEVKPPAIAAKQRIREHLLRIKPLTGEYKWHPVGKAFFELWYHQNKHDLQKEVDPFLRGFRRSMDVQLLKVAMLTDMAQPEPTFLMTRPLLEESLATIQAVIPNMSRLSVAAGRNPYAVPQAELLEFIEKEGGILPEKTIRRHDQDLGGWDMDQVLDHLKRSGRLFEVKVPIPDSKPPMCRLMLCTEKKYRSAIKNGEIKNIKPTL